MNSKKIDKTTLGIAGLSLSAAALLVANLMPPKAQASDTIRGDQYFAVTGRITQGGDGLYLTNRDGMMAVFVYNPNTKQVEPRVIGSVTDAFNGAGGAAAGGGAAGGSRVKRP